jgi:transposase
MKANVHQLADFTNKNIYVGMDVHKKSWSVSLFCESEFIRNFTQPPSVEALEKLLRRDFPGANYICAYEAGFSGFWVQRQLTSKGIPCKVIHAVDIPQSGKRKTIKRDSIDSKGIGQALAAGMLNSIYIPNPDIEADRSLIRYRERLQKDIARCKNRIKSLLNQHGFVIPEKLEKSWTKKLVFWLKEFNQAKGTIRISLDHMIDQMILLRQTLLKVNRDIRALQNSEKYKREMDLLMSVPGIGPLTAITLLTEIMDINRFSSFLQMNSFVGLYPMEHSSGENEHKGSITIRHNKPLRRMLIEAAWIAVRYDPALIQVFQQWKQRMTSKRAIVKIARKLLSRIHYVWKTGVSYEKGLIK